MVTRRKPKTTQNSPAANNEETVEKSSTDTVSEKPSTPATEKKQPPAKKEPEPKVHIGRRVWPD